MSLETSYNEIINGRLLQNFSNMWTIYRFMKHFISFDYPILESPIFSPDANRNTNWRIHLYPNGENEENCGYLSIFLILLKCDFEAEFSFTFSILNSKGDKVNKRTMEKLKFSPGPHRMMWGFPNFARKELIFKKENNLLTHFMLTICCEINFTGHLLPSLNVPQTAPGLHKDFEMLLETGKFSDVTLICQGEKFLAHKNILAARSPVFSAMFEHDMKEKRENIVEIPDLKPEALREMLRFVYTNRIVNIHADFCDIISAANKYQLDELKSHCETALSGKLNVENAVVMLILADQANANQLKSKTMEFVLVHLREISDSLGFKTLGQSHWCLMKEILTSVALYRDNINRR